MSRVPMTQAVAADYADAMLVARRAKNVIFLLLALIIFIQLAVFFVARFVPSVKFRTEVTTTATDANSSSMTLIERKSAENGDRSRIVSPILEQVIAGTDFLGVLFSIILPVLLMLLLAIMLVGRLVGVSHVTSAFCWSILFLVLLFPWQALLNSGHAHGPRHLSASAPATMPANTEYASDEIPDVRIPGTLYTFPELRRNYDFPNSPAPYAILGWGRFVVMPVIELIILLMVQGRSRRGLRFALGESEMKVDAPLAVP